jgi:hypothetical protein
MMSKPLSNAKMTESNAVSILEDTANAKFFTVILLWTMALSLPTLFPLTAWLSATVLFILVLLPAVMLSVYHRNIYVSDPIVIVGGLWIIAGTLPIWFPELYRDRLWTTVSITSVEDAALWMARGWAFGSIAYWAARIVSIKRREGIRTLATIKVHQVRLAIGLIGIFSTLVYIFYIGGAGYSHIDGFQVATTSGQIIHEVRQLALVYAFLYLRAAPRGQTLPIEKYMFMATVAVCLAVLFASASKIIALQFIAVWLLAKASDFSGKNNRMKMVLIMGAALLATYAVFQWVTAYRLAVTEVLESSSGDTGFSGTMQAQVTAIGLATSNLFFPPPTAVGSDEYDTGSVLDRMGLLSAFATVLDVTGGVPPYETSFTTFLTPLYAVMPRNLFPDKVDFIGAGSFAELLGWKFGGFSVTLPGSFYWIWGYAGIPLGMAGLMAMVGWVQDRADGEGLGALYAKSILILSVLTLLDFGSTIHPLIIQLCRATLVIGVLQFIAPIMFSKRRFA